MKRENSPFCELSVEHQKGQMWDLGIGFLQTDAMMWRESEGGIYPSDPGPLEGSRDHKLFLMGSRLNLMFKVCRFRMRPSEQQSVTKSNFPREHYLE